MLIALPDHTSVYARWRTAGLGLVLLCALVLVPGLMTIGPVDRDESRFAQASRQMVESGDWVVPRVQDRARLNKPPLVYWLQSLSVKALGDPEGTADGNIWVFRVPSAVCALLTVLATWRLGLRLFDPRAAMLGAALLAVSPMLVWDAHQARADQLLLLTVVLAQRGLFEIASRALAGRRAGLVWPMVFWIAVAAGILAKGPITPMIALLTALALSVLARRAGWMWASRPVLGLVILIAMVGPWIGAVVARVGLGEYWSIVYAETLGRSAEPAEGHWGPPGYHLVAVCVLFWPGVLLTAAAVRRGVSRGVRLKPLRVARRPEAFLLAWVLPAWLVFELVSTKLPHYTLPLYPALALLSARAVFAAQAGSLQHATSLGARLGFVLWGVIGVLALGGVTIASLLPSVRGGAASGLMPATTTLIAAGAIVLAVLVVVPLATLAAVRGRVVKAQLIAVALTAAWGAVFLHAVLPASPALWVSPRLANVLREADPPRDDRAPASIGLVGYHEDSAIFLTRGRARRLDAQDVRSFLARNRRALVAIDRERIKGAGGEDLGAIDELEWLGSVRGLNYSTGKPVSIDVYRKGPP